MPSSWLVVMIASGIFLLLGLASFLWGRREANEDYQSITARADIHTDIKKVVQDWQANSGSGSLKMGGLLSIIIGLFLLALSVTLLLRG